MQEFSCVYENINNTEKNTEAPLISMFKKFDIKYVQIKGNIITCFLSEFGLKYNINLNYKFFETLTKIRHLGKVATRKIAFMKKLRVDYILPMGMLAPFLLKTFLPVQQQ